MAIIVASVAILFSILSFFIARSKASKRALEEIRSRNSELQSRLDELHRQVSIIQEPSTSVVPSLIEPEGASNVILMLKTELGCIRRDLQANAEKLSIHSEAIKAIQQKQPASEPSESTPPKIILQQLSPFGEFSQSTQERIPFPPLSTLSGLAAEQRIHPAEGFSNIEEPTAQHPEPYDQLLQQYHDALHRGDRQALRQMQVKELNITSESEETLLKGSNEQATKLQAVLGGGSYMLISGLGRYWLFPTSQTLDSFNMNQPQKGIFGYEREILSKPVVKKPAEVKEDGDYWVVVEQGVISIPG